MHIHSNKIENAQLLILNCKYPSVYMQYIYRAYKYSFNIKFKAFKKDYKLYMRGILLENKPATISRDKTCGRKLLAGI